MIRDRSPRARAAQAVPPPRRIRGTRTRAFGSSSREGHDAARFYTSRLYDGLRPADDPGSNGHSPETPLPPAVANRILCQSSTRMTELPDGCAHLMITSPPYNATKVYDRNLTLSQYLGLLRKVFTETYRVLAPGGRACVNVANLGRKPYIPLSTHVVRLMNDIGFRMRGEIIWNKAASAGGSCAWGSWNSPANPTLRDVHEYILVFCKADYSRPKAGRKSTIKPQQFLEYTKSIWTFPTESARRIGHPAPFPLELPRRLIQLYSYKGDVVLDPFAGSGTTCVAAREAGRRFVGYDVDASYCRLARRRLAVR